jgi:hypothetical protein
VEEENGGTRKERGAQMEEKLLVEDERISQISRDKVVPQI